MEKQQTIAKTEEQTTTQAKVVEGLKDLKEGIQGVDSTTNSSKPASKSSKVDPLTKIREEERAKLEALRQKEQEKTRLAIEKERLRLEAELAKEIEELESQLERAQSTNQKSKEKMKIDLKETETVVPESKSKADKIEFVDVEDHKELEDIKKTKTTKKKTSSSKTTKKRTKSSNSKTVKADISDTEVKVQIDKSENQKVEKPKKEEQTKKAEQVEVKAKQDNLEVKTSSEEPKVQNLETKSESTSEQKIEAKEVLNETSKKEQKIEPKASIEENSIQKTIVKDQEETMVNQILSSESNKDEVTEQMTEAEKLQNKVQANKALEIAEQNKDIKSNIEVNIQQAKEEVENSVKADDNQHQSLGVSLEKENDANIKTEVNNKIDKKEDESSEQSQSHDESKTVINSLQKLREKINAQKKLEKELMEKEATRIQEKDKNLQEKFNLLNQYVEEENDYITIDELEAEKKKVEELKSEKQELDSIINNFRDIIDRILSLEVNGVKVINTENYQLNSDFIEISLNNQELNNTIKEIEIELDYISKSHEDKIRKLIVAENSYQQLKELYDKQEEVIKDLNKQIVGLKEEVRKEKTINHEVTLQLQKLQSEKYNMNNRNSYYNNRNQYQPEYHSQNQYSYNQYNNLRNLSDSEKYTIINDLDRLSNDIKNLLSTDELSKTKELLKAKDIEIDNLRYQIQNPYHRYDNRYQSNENHCPYYAAPAPMYMSKPANIIPNEKLENDVYFQEIKKLKEEIEQLKKNPNNESNSNRFEESMNLIKEVREELNRNREEREKSTQQQKPIEDFKNVFPEEKKTPEVRNDFNSQTSEPEATVEEPKKPTELVNETNPTVDLEKEEQLKKIENLEQQIKDKDLELQKISADNKRLSEEDILDPEFKRKIRVIRDMKKDLLNRAKQEEDIFQNSVQTIKHKIDIKKQDINELNDRIAKLDVNYQENRDFSSAAKDAYEKAKGKAYIELQLQEERLHELEDDLSRANSKYESFLESKDEQMNKLNQNEIETIEFYLNKLRLTYKTSDGNYSNTLNERDDLIKELDKLQTSNSNEKDLSDKNDNKEENKNEINPCKQLENEIRELTREYNEYYRQITDLKSELEKRLDFEKRLRTNDNDVYEYHATKIYLEDCLREYRSKNEAIESKQLELEKIIVDMAKRTEQLKLKADIQDIEVHKEDLRAKIDFYKKHISDLERKESVQKYNSLIAQIEKIRSVQKEQRDKAEAIKLDVQSKTKDLENLKSEKMHLI